MVGSMESIPLCENDNVKQGEETLSIILVASSVSQYKNKQQVHAYSKNACLIMKHVGLNALYDISLATSNY